MPGGVDAVPAATAWLGDLIAGAAPDLIHINGYGLAAAGFDLPCLVVAHSCVATWWRAVHGSVPPDEWDGYRRLVAAGLNGADAVVAPSHAFLRQIEATYGPLSEARVIANGRDAAAFRPAAKAPFVLAAGRLWDEAKNLAALDAAAADLAWPVLAAGPWRRPGGGGAPPRHLRALGPLAPAQLARQMAEAAIFAAPARYEPFGLAVLEAALSGCALVLGDIPTFRELWEDAALFVPPEDSSALRRALASLIAAPERRAGLAAAAQHRARLYGAAEMVDRYAALYAALRPRAAPPLSRQGFP
jgi:glycosyltransferase involved in cell wall biosynthesis